MNRIEQLELILKILRVSEFNYQTQMFWYSGEIIKQYDYPKLRWDGICHIISHLYDFNLIEKSEYRSLIDYLRDFRVLEIGLEEFESHCALYGIYWFPLYQHENAVEARSLRINFIKRCIEYAKTV